MRIRSVIIIFLTLFSFNINAQLQRDWTTYVSPLPGGLIKEVVSATDALGNTFVFGKSSNGYGHSLDFDPAAPYYALNDRGDGYFDASLAKYDANGQFVFAKSFKVGLLVEDVPFFIRINSNNEIIIVFKSEGDLLAGPLDIDPGSGVVGINHTNGVYTMLKLDNNGNYMNSFNFIQALSGSTGICQINDLEIDNNDNIILVGHLREAPNYDFDPSASVDNITFAGSAGSSYTTTAGFIAKYQDDGVLGFVAPLYPQGSNQTNVCALTDVEIDGSNNILTMGSLLYSVDLDPTAGSSLLSVGSTATTFIAKYDNNGSYLEERHYAQQSYAFGNSSDNRTRKNNELEILNSGDIAVIVTQIGTTDYDFGVGTATLPGANSLSFYTTLAVYSSSFALLDYGTFGTANQFYSEIEVDASDNIYVYANCYSDFDIELGTSTLTLVNDDGFDGALIKYSSDLTLLEYVHFSESEDELIGSISINAYQEPVISGVTKQYGSAPTGYSLDLDPGTGNTDIPLNAAFLLNYTTSLSTDWVVTLVSPRPALNNQIFLNSLIDQSDNLYLLGYISGDYDTTAYVNAPFPRECKGLTKYNSSGAMELTIPILDADVSQHEVDGAGNIYITGNFTGTAEFYDGTTYQPYTSASGGTMESLFFAKYNATGVLQFVKLLNASVASSNIDCYDITVSNAGEIFLVGGFVGTFDFNPGTGNLVYATNALGDQDAFFAKYDSNGNMIFANTVNSGTLSYLEEANHVKVEANGNITLVGQANSYYSDFDPTAATETLSLSSLGNVGFAATYGPFGNFISSELLWDGTLESTNLHFDGSNNVCITGSFTSLSSGSQTLTAVGQGDYAILRYDNNWVIDTMMQLGNASYDETKIISQMDENGNLNIMASIQGVTDVDPTSTTQYLSTSGGSVDYLMARYNSDNEPIYAFVMGGPDNEFENWFGMSINNDGLVYTYSLTNKEVNHDFTTNPYYVYSLDETPTISKYQQSRLTATATVDQQVLCAGQSTGQATVVPDGSHPPYTYLWAPSGATTATATGLSGGMQTVTVTDALGTTVSLDVEITSPSTSLSGTVATQSDVTCFGGSNGSAGITPAGGTSPYNYSWSPSGGSSAFASGLSSGNYTVTISDANNCTQDVAVSISEPFPLTLSLVSQVNVACNGGSNGAATVSASGGSGSNSFSWSPITVSGPTATNLSAGSYTAQVQDLNGCLTQLNVTITEPAVLNASVGSIQNVTCASTTDGSATVNVTGGVTPYQYAWLPQGGSGVTATNLPVGNYIVNVQDGNGCTTSTPVEIQNLLPTQDVCVVTVDTLAADHNIVIWEKDAAAGNIDSFYVYREVTTNTYNKIGAVHYDSLSLFEDYTANPNSTSYKYRITALDTCGSEGDYGLYHKSIHLQYSGLGNFQWTFYEIENTSNQVASYNFWRDDLGNGNWQILQTVSGSTSSYTDVDYALYPNAIYRVDLNWIGGYICTPSKANINTSRSNKKGNVAGSGSNIIESLSERVKAYPNPSAGDITLSVPQTMVGHFYILRDGLGKLIITDVINNSNEFINLSILETGIYFIQIPTEYGLISKKIIKN